MTRLDDQAEDVFVQVIDLGPEVTAKEAVTMNSDGSYTIFINSRYNYEQQMESIRHAIRHVQRDDFRRDDVQQIEAEAHGIVDPERKEDPRLERIRKNSQIRLKKLQRSKKKRRKELEERREFIEFLMDNVPAYAKEHKIFY